MWPLYDLIAIAFKLAQLTERFELYNNTSEVSSLAAAAS